MVARNHRRFPDTRFLHHKQGKEAIESFGINPVYTGVLIYDYRGREQACACPPAQIPACALTHGAPTSDDDERPLVKPRALKPVAVTRETPTQGRHRKCVLHYLNRQCRVVVSTDRLGVDP